MSTGREGLRTNFITWECQYPLKQNNVKKASLYFSMSSGLEIRFMVLNPLCSILCLRMLRCTVRHEHSVKFKVIKTKSRFANGMSEVRTPEHGIWDLTFRKAGESPCPETIRMSPVRKHWGSRELIHWPDGHCCFGACAPGEWLLCRPFREKGISNRRQDWIFFIWANHRTNEAWLWSLSRVEKCSANRILRSHGQALSIWEKTCVVGRSNDLHSSNV